MKIKEFKNGLIRITGDINGIEMERNYIGMTQHEALTDFLHENTRLTNAAMHNRHVFYTDTDTGKAVRARVLDIIGHDVRTDRDGMRTKNELLFLIKTKEDISYKLGPGGKRITIPAGTPVFPADNLPDKGYWCYAWEGMSEQEQAWNRNYGFWVSKSDTDIELPF